MLRRPNQTNRKFKIEQARTCRGHNTIITSSNKVQMLDSLALSLQFLNAAFQTIDFLLMTEVSILKVFDFGLHICMVLIKFFENIIELLVLMDQSTALKQFEERGMGKPGT